MEFVNDGLFDWNLETSEIYYSPGWKRLVGYADDELPNDFSVWETLTDPDDVKRSWKMQQELIQKKRDRFEIEFRMKHKNGHWVDILSRANAIFNKEGKAVRIVGTHVDISDRKKTEAALKIKDAAIENALSGFDIIDQDGRLIYVNRAFVLMYGYDSAEEMLDVPPADLCEDPSLPERVIKALQEKGEHIFEHKAKRKNGTLFDVLMYARLSHDENGREIYPTTSIDVSDRKRNELALTKSGLIVESTSDAIITTDPDGAITLWNSGAENLYGYKPEEVIGKSVKILYKEEDLHILTRMMDDLLAGKELKNLEVTCIDKKGRDVNILLSLMTLKDEYGNVVELVGFTKDISALKQYEQQILMEKEKLEQYLDLAGVVFVALDPEGDVSLINKKGCELLGYDHKEIIGKNWFDHFIPQWLKQELMPVSQQLLSGDVGSAKYYENPILTRSGEERLIAWHNNVLTDPDGRVIGHLSAGEDITEKKELEAKLQQAQRMESIGTLAGGIAHEFNNILSIIVGNNELIMEDLPESSLSRENTEEIRIAGLRARDIVKQLLTFSRQDNVAKEPIDVRSVVKDSIKLIRATTPANFDIQDRLSKDCFPIKANATQINQVLINLCSNAIDALPVSGGRVDIVLENADISSPADPSAPGAAPGKYVRLAVADNGSGMNANTLNRIFEPYFTTKEMGKGSGIGLAVVHGIVENHRGTITCDSTMGEGSRFTIHFPAHDGQIKGNGIIEESALPVGHEKILYVDDEPGIAKLGRIHLTGLGYDAVSTTDPAEALAWIKEDPLRFDLVISDVAMPMIPGDELIRQVLTLRPDMPAIICTGYSERMSESDARELGVAAFLMKPLDKSELAVKVRQVLDSRA